MTRFAFLAFFLTAACQTASSAPRPLPTTTTSTFTTTTSTVPVPVAPLSTPSTEAPPRRHSPPAAVGGAGSHLERIAACESGGNPRAVSRSGRYTGRYQFDDRTWASVGGSGRAMDAPEAEQDARAAELYRRRGSQPWPECGR